MNDKVCKLKNLYNDMKINILITFDQYGVSYHKNHIDCYHACYKIYKESNNISICLLETYPIYKK